MNIKILKEDIKKHPNKIAAVICMLLALLFAYMIYDSEYKFTSDKAVLSAAITEYASHGRYALKDAYVLETKEIDGILIAFFIDNNNPNIYGFTRLLRGINLKYRLISANYGPSPYSAFVEIYSFDTKKGKYYAVGGYNCDKNIASYGLPLSGEDSSKTKYTLIYNLNNSQFLDILKDSDLQKSIKELPGKEKKYLLYYKNAALLDSEGNDITENYKIPNSNSSWGSGVATAELFVLNVIVAIILILGAVFARYFWSKK